MDISCVILTWNSEKYVSKCLESLLRDLDENQFSYEIFVVDNGSTDNTVEIVNSYKDKFPQRIFPIYLKKNMGTTFSRNLALRRVEGAYVVIMDSDVEVMRGTIRPLIKIFQECENVGIVAPKLLYPTGHVQKSVDHFPTLPNKLKRYFFLKMIEKRQEKEQIESITEVDYAISAMWILKKDVLNKVGFLDEAIFYAPEDVDYCLRTWLSGNKVLYCPEVTAIHQTQEASRGFTISRLKIEHIKGLAYYFKKHKYLFRRPQVSGRLLSRCL
jgi:GT2 family glycosyltransferase